MYIIALLYFEAKQYNDGQNEFFLKFCMRIIVADAALAFGGETALLLMTMSLIHMILVRYSIFSRRLGQRKNEPGLP